MSVALLKNEISRFLAAEEAEILCISGKWGVGKSFAWNSCLRSARDAKHLARSKYAYVSLFGLTSIEDLRFSIFENLIDVSQIGTQPNLEALRDNISATVSRLGRKSLSLAQRMPVAKDYIGGLRDVWFQLVQNAIVCLDDVERTSDDIKLNDILGLASSLKERRQCKVVLILNSDALGEQRSVFDALFEKVIDAHIAFQPTAQEAASIALSPSDDLDKKLEVHCTSLGITNIRIIQKAHRFAKKIVAPLQDFDQGVLNQAVQTLALLTWSVYEPAIAPNIEYLKNRYSGFFPLDDKPIKSEAEVAWDALLDACGFGHLDEFDLSLLAGVKAGFFDMASLKQHAAALNATILSGKAAESFSTAWRLFHDSFDNNQDEVLDAIYSSFVENVQHIAPNDLNGTYILLTDLGRAEQAESILSIYLERRPQTPEAFDISDYAFMGQISNEQVANRLKQKLAELQQPPDPISILQNISETKSWSEKEVELLASLEADAYYAAFKNAKGTSLRRLIAGALQFDRISNASVSMREVSKRAKEALEMIGRESPINARRVRKYGINIAE